jgi:hypothetical protein
MSPPKAVVARARQWADIPGMGGKFGTDGYALFGGWRQFEVSTITKS